jgi:hypothetical protein
MKCPSNNCNTFTEDRTALGAFAIRVVHADADNHTPTIFSSTGSYTHTGTLFKWDATPAEVSATSLATTAASNVFTTAATFTSAQLTTASLPGVDGTRTCFKCFGNQDIAAASVDISAAIDDLEETGWATTDVCFPNSGSVFGLGYAMTVAAILSVLTISIF